MFKLICISFIIEFAAVSFVDLSGNSTVHFLNEEIKESVFALRWKLVILEEKT